MICCHFLAISPPVLFESRTEVWLGSHIGTVRRREVIHGLMRVLVATMACQAFARTDSPQSLTQPSTQSPPLDAPIVKVLVDGERAATAVVNVSEVTFDASETPGDKLRFEIQFGDGDSASTSVSTHVYRTPGTYKATITSIDAAGRKASTNEDVVVRVFQGVWFQAGVNPRTRRFEGRRLTVTDQEGADLRGVYASWGEPDRMVTGRLSALLLPSGVGRADAS